MGQSPISPIRAANLSQPELTVIPPEPRLRNQAIASAVRVLNSTAVAGPNREITFSGNAATRQPVVRVVDKLSGDVIAQWPSEYALRLAEQYKSEHPEK